MNSNEKIQLDFNAFDLEDCYASNVSCSCVYDYVEVKYGDETTKFCGSSRPDRITSTGSSMTVTMKTDYSVNGTGFTATWAAVSTFRDGSTLLRNTQAQVQRVVEVYEASSWNYLQLAIEICYLGKVLKLGRPFALPFP